MKTITKDEVIEQVKEIQNKIIEVQDAIDSYEDGEMHDEYNDMIDECNGLVTIFGMEYNASHVLELVDPIAYRCGYNDYCDAPVSELQNELDSLNDELDELEKDFEDME